MFRLNHYPAAVTMTSIGNETPSWQYIDPTLCPKLEDPRLQLHWAVQLCASVAAVYAEPHKDDSHRNLGWNTGRGLFISQPMGLEKTFHVAVRPVRFGLLLLNENEETVTGYSLIGNTFQDALGWLNSAIADFLELGTETSLNQPEYDLPSHPVSQGSVFTAAPAGYAAEIATAYSNAKLLLEPLSNAYAEASRLRCWPPHFDYATLLSFQDATDTSVKSIGIGFSPGDHHYNEPYWYVTPWPYPDSQDVLPELDGHGFWHTDNWLGAILPCNTFTPESAAKQELQTRAFLASAEQGCRIILGLK